MEAFTISTASIAVGELGDKTQLLSLILATRLRKPMPIAAELAPGSFYRSGRRTDL